MNGNPRIPANLPAGTGVNWVALQAEAVRREALAVEWEARTVEIEAGGVIPPFGPLPPEPQPEPDPSGDPTLSSVAAEAQQLADDSKILLNQLPANSGDWAAVKAIRTAAKAFARKIQAEAHDVTSMDALADEAQTLSEVSAALLDSITSPDDITLIENLRRHIKAFCDQVAARAKRAAD
jgi:hypothetical protein